MEKLKIALLFPGKDTVKYLKVVGDTITLDLNGTIFKQNGFFIEHNGKYLQVADLDFPFILSSIPTEFKNLEQINKQVKFIPFDPRIATLGTSKVVFAYENPVLTEEECNKTNGYWNSGECFLCSVGSQYPDRENLQCVDCPLDSKCGDHQGYCKGPGPCVENISDRTFKLDCSGKCGDYCSGSCGAGEVFGWTCKETNGIYKCQFDPANWWILTLWIIFFLFILALIILVIFAIFRA